MASPRVLPPEETSFYLQKKNNNKIKNVLSNFKCKGITIRKPVLHTEVKFIQIDDDDDEIIERNNNLRRSKGEFCLTIGKHIRKPPKIKSLTEVEDAQSHLDLRVGEEEEGTLYNKYQFI